MQELKNHWILAAIVLLCLVNISFGLLGAHVAFSAAGSVGLCYVALRFGYLVRVRRKEVAPPPLPATSSGRPAAALQPPDPTDPADTDGLVRQMLAQGRFALLLRRQIAEGLSDTLFAQSRHALEESMALVPDGEVMLGPIDESPGEDVPEDARVVQRRVRVERFFLDRFPVTNRQFHDFVAAGGYEQMALWEESIWPAVLSFVDRSGMPGPRFWTDGRFSSTEEDLPVVGVSWYEAVAYARWLGKRLPSNAEWVKAASWPVCPSSEVQTQRKYPWGDTMDRSRANLWGSGPESIVAVEKFSEGVSVGGVYQLIGNVWEWTGGSFRGTDFGASNDPADALLLPAPLKSIRGGAFNTYFDNQATCQFQSGENPLHRRHNVGFRCAVGVCDLALTRVPPNDPETRGESQSPTTEEVCV